ncbi:hypothetical protein [Fortiea contorta]|uniref:hypothetical protein n=1 Tax=Fortiea contorta TaxID=1892405 RepID=UPI0003484788|nr:hypothetical protein [Fortiea contorta]
MQTKLTALKIHLPTEDVALTVTVIHRKIQNLAVALEKRLQNLTLKADYPEVAKHLATIRVRLQAVTLIRKTQVINTYKDDLLGDTYPTMICESNINYVHLSSLVADQDTLRHQILVNMLLSRRKIIKSLNYSRYKINYYGTQSSLRS